MNLLLGGEPTTVWERKNALGVFEHNHIEDGHSEADAPAAVSDLQRAAWKNAEWKRIHAWLVDGKLCLTPNNTLSDSSKK